jgi:uncharacterized protein YukE
MSELLDAAAARWVEAAGLLAGVGRVPAALLGWLGPAWSGPAARAYDEWAGRFEDATRRTAGALRDAGDAARRHAGQWPDEARRGPVELGLSGVDAGSRSITAVPVPGPRAPTGASGCRGGSGGPPGAEPGGPVRLMPVLGLGSADAVFPGVTDGATLLDPSAQDGPAHGGSAGDGSSGSGCPAHGEPAGDGSHHGGHDHPAVQPDQPSQPDSGDQPDGASQPGPTPAAPGHHPGGHGRVDTWIQQAIAVLRAHGYRADQLDPDAIAAIVAHESAGDPGAVNDWDANAARGTPSMGLMQTIAPTFELYHLPGHGEILDPVDNIIAGVRYAVDRYGSVSQVPGVLSLAAGRGYRGY